MSLKVYMICFVIGEGASGGAQVLELETSFI